MKKLLLLITFFPLLIAAQNDDNLSCRQLNDKAMDVYLSNPKLASQLLEKAAIKTNTSENQHLKGLTLNNQAILKRMNGEFLESKKMSEKALTYTNTNAVKASVYNNLGACNRSLGLHEQAIKYYLSALKLYEKQKDSKKQGTVDNNIGLVFSDLEQFEKAKGYHRKALTVFTKIKDKKGLSESYNNLAIVLASQDSLATAGSFFRKSLRIEEGLKDKKGIAESLNNVGGVHYYLGAIDSALYYFKKSADMERALKNFSGVAASYNNIAMVYIENKRLPSAKQYIDSAYSYSEKSKVATDLLASLDNYRQYHEASNNFAEANKMMKKYYAVKDSLQKQSSVKDLNELETKYQTAKKEKMLLEKEIEVKNTRYSLIGVAFLALFIGLVGFLIYRQQKIKNKQQEQEFQLKSAIAAIESQNKLQEQRLSISRDLHDNIGAQLTFVISSVDNLKYGNQITDGKITNQLTKISDFTKSTIIELRDTIWAMNTSEFSFDDLRSRIFNFIEKAKTAKENIAFNFEVDESLKDQKFSSIIGINLYRTIQEAVNNALKYSDADAITVKVASHYKKIKVEIHDNGKGFHVDKVTHGNGLNNMVKRIEEIDGSCEIDSHAKQGTTIRILIAKTQ